MHVAISVVYDAGGRPSYGVSQVEDIRSRKDTEAQLEERFRELATNVDIGFLLRQIDPPEYLYYNPAYLSIFGFDPTGPAPTPQDSMALIDPQDVAAGRAESSARPRAVSGSSRNGGLPGRTDSSGGYSDGSRRSSTATGRSGASPGYSKTSPTERTPPAVLAESQDQFQELANNVDVGFLHS